jgi:hypothetical protein
MFVLPPLAALLIDFSPILGLFLMKFAAQDFSLINERMEWERDYNPGSIVV